MQQQLIGVFDRDTKWRIDFYKGDNSNWRMKLSIPLVSAPFLFRHVYIFSLS